MKYTNNHLVILLLIIGIVSVVLYIMIFHRTASDDRAEGFTTPFINTALHVDKSSKAMQYLQTAQDDSSEHQLMQNIAFTAQAKWVSMQEAYEKNNDSLYQYLKTARAEARLPVIVVYNIPLRDCGNYSAGGALSAEEYQQWINVVSKTIKGDEVVIILEPDALSMIDCLTPSETQQRYELLYMAVEQFTHNPRASVYIDAGNPGWIDAPEMTRRLRSAGIAKAKGFALNVSNFYKDQLNVQYGQDVSDLLEGNKRFIIDSSRNGAGPTTDNEWCNPRGRALGTAPQAVTNIPYLDAFLWVKRPGESDGECNGGPPAGQWWPEYALELVQNTQNINRP